MGVRMAVFDMEGAFSNQMVMEHCFNVIGDLSMRTTSKGGEPVTLEEPGKTREPGPHDDGVSSCGRPWGFQPHRNFP